MPVRISRRLLLALAVVVGVLAFGIAPRTILAPGCTGATDATFGGSVSVPLCDPVVVTHADSGVSLHASAVMPGWGPYGAGSELAGFDLDVAEYAAADATTGYGTIDVRPELPRLLLSDAPRYEWSGPCRLEPAEGSLLVACELAAVSGSDRLAMRTRIPAPPDPLTDARFHQIEVTYRLAGGHVVAGTTTTLHERLPTTDDTVGGRLADGSLLVFGFGPTTVGWTRLSLTPSTPPEWSAPDVPSPIGNIVFEHCTASPGSDATGGSLSCVGGRQESPSDPGLPVSLEASWHLVR